MHLHTPSLPLLQLSVRLQISNRSRINAFRRKKIPLLAGPFLVGISLSLRAPRCAMVPMK